MKINRSSWHYRFRAWVLRQEGLPTYELQSPWNVTLGEYVSDILVLGIMGMPFRIVGRIISWLMKADIEIEFYNDKEER